MPWTEDPGDVLPAAQPTANHRALTWPRWPRSGWGHYRRNLWRTQISDILIPEDPEERYPDSGRIALTSGWYVVQLSGARHGIAPGVDIISEVPPDGSMLSVWSARPRNQWADADRSKRDVTESGSRAGFPAQPPHYLSCGSAQGGSTKGSRQSDLTTHSCWRLAVSKAVRQSSPSCAQAYTARERRRRRQQRNHSCSGPGESARLRHGRRVARCKHIQLRAVSVRLPVCRLDGCRSSARPPSSQSNNRSSAHNSFQAMRPQLLIAVNDVEASSRWQSLVSATLGMPEYARWTRIRAIELQRRIDFAAA